MRINQNIPSLFAYNAHSALNGSLSKAIQKLSTGLRINSAADDAAGLAISEKMRAQTHGLDQAVSNSQDGISMIQTAEGALNETHSILQRMRELSVQAANDTLTQEDREYIQLEIASIREEIGRISTTTQFNKKQLLDGSSDALWSSDELDVWLNVKGATASRDQFGQSVVSEGNYKVNVAAVTAGRNQVMKSSILTLAEDASVVAGKNSRLSDLANFVDANGVSLLESPQQLTVSFEDGGSVSFTAYAGDTIGLLGEKFAAAMRQAAGGTEEGSPVQFVGEDNVSASGEDYVAPWLEGAAERINDLLGLDGNGKTLAVRSYTPESGDWRGMYVQWTGGSDEIFLYMNSAVINENTSDAQMGTLTVHEMVHASIFADPALREHFTSVSGTEEGAWMTEGIAEYLAGGNWRVVDFAASKGAGYLGAIDTEIERLFNDTPADDYTDWTDSTPMLDTAYTASYLAVRYFDEKSLASGGTGVKGLLDELKKSGVSMNDAINAASGGLYTDIDALETALRADTAYLDRVAGEDPAVDAGAKGGKYASGGAATPASAVIGPSGLQSNPLADYGWEKVDWSGQVDPGESTTLAISAAQAGTLQSVEGTLLLHSPLAGKAGRMTLSGDEKMLAALGFAEIQSAEDTLYEVTISDAHSGNLVASNMKFSGSVIVEALNNIDISMGTNFALSLDGEGTKSGGYGTYAFTREDDEFLVHVASNATALQIGANEGENMILSFGDTGVRALGIDKVSALSRELAARSVTIIDKAINLVSSKRARLGAYQNRLEHTINNLTTASSNMSASESRIRDTDMSKLMMDFTKLNILSQSSTAMMSQANQLPQAVLTLMR